MIPILIVLLIILFAVTYNLTYKRTNQYKNECIDIKNFYKNLYQKPIIVNLGSTYSKFGFGASDSLNLNIADFSLQAQSLDYDYALLCQYKDKLADKSVIFITLAACCMLYEGNPTNPLYYKVLDNKHIPHKNVKGMIRNLFPAFFNFKKSLKALLLHSELYENVYDSVKSQVIPEESEKVADAYARGWINMFGLKNLQDINIGVKNLDNLRHNTEYLQKIIDECKGNGFIPVIVIPPFSDRLNMYFSTDFKQLVLNDSIEVANRDYKVPVMDYQIDAFFQKNYGLFLDGCFRLNEAGSRAFIKRLAKDLSAYGIIINNGEHGKKYV